MYVGGSAGADASAEAGSKRQAVTRHSSKPMKVRDDRPRDTLSPTTRIRQL
jgi:hypothetical protein